MESRSEVQIVQYIRNKHRRPIGVMLAMADGDKLNIGFSLCCKRDKFSKKFGLGVALIRAALYANAVHVSAVRDGMYHRGNYVVIPYTVFCHLPQFIKKCQLKYNGKYELPEWAKQLNKWGVK